MMRWGKKEKQCRQTSSDYNSCWTRWHRCATRIHNSSWSCPMQGREYQEDNYRDRAHALTISQCHACPTIRDHPIMVPRAPGTLIDHHRW